MNEKEQVQVKGNESTIFNLRIFNKIKVINNKEPQITKALKKISAKNSHIRKWQN